jgi:uncharacterized protein (DUF3084 family)
MVEKANQPAARDQDMAEGANQLTTRDKYMVEGANQLATRYKEMVEKANQLANRDKDCQKLESRSSMGVGLASQLRGGCTVGKKMTVIRA